VALHRGMDADRKVELQVSYIGFECMLLARYDREVAAALFRPMEAYLRSLAAAKGSQDQFNSASIVAWSCIEPRGAVALLDSLEPPREFAPAPPYHAASPKFATWLGRPPDRRGRR